MYGITEVLSHHVVFKQRRHTPFKEFTANLMYFYLLFVLIFCSWLLLLWPPDLLLQSNTGTTFQKRKLLSDHLAGYGIISDDLEWAGFSFRLAEERTAPQLPQWSGLCANWFSKRSKKETNKFWKMPGESEDMEKYVHFGQFPQIFREFSVNFFRTKSQLLRKILPKESSSHVTWPQNIPEKKQDHVPKNCQKKLVPHS